MNLYPHLYAILRYDIIIVKYPAGNIENLLVIVPIQEIFSENLIDLRIMDIALKVHSSLM